jgi:hypothetical protein
MPDPDDQDGLPLSPDPSPAPPAIGSDLTTVLSQLAAAQLQPHEQTFVSRFKRRRGSRRQALLYLNWLAVRYGTTQLAAGEIPAH